MSIYSTLRKLRSIIPNKYKPDNYGKCNIDKNGFKTGSWLERVETSVVPNLFNGTAHTDYFVWYEGCYFKGKKTGVWVSWYEYNSFLHSKVDYADDEYSPISQMYFFDSGELYMERHGKYDVDGSYVMNAIYYFKNGYIKEEWCWNKGSKFYRENGSLRSEHITIDPEKKIFDCIDYDENGQIVCHHRRQYNKETDKYEPTEFFYGRG